MKNVLLGIDIGTSSCKVVLFRPDGTVVAEESREYSVYYPQPGWVEQDPEEWWEAVCGALLAMKIKTGTLFADIAGIGIDGQGWSAIPVDADGNVLCHSPIWMDTRAAGICEEWNERIGADRIFEICGNPLAPSYTLPKILWFKKNRPDVYRRTHKILQSNSFIGFRMTGCMTQDISQGYAWQCFDIRKGCWSEEACRLFGLDIGMLPDILPCHQVIGSVTASAAALTGLAEGTPVVAGGLDAACGTLGAGVIHPGETQEQGGQAGGMSICLDTYKADPRLILSYHVVPGMWLLQGGTVGGGGVMRWFEREFCAEERMDASRNGKTSLAGMDLEAESVPVGSDGMIFLPYMAGERSPLWDTRAKGVYYGIDYAKTRAHFIRASMEGVAFSLKHNLDVARETGADVQVLCSMGGAANSRFWTQMKADVTGKRIVVPASDTATALGAAILAGVGTGVYSDFEDAVSRTIRIRREHIPDMTNHIRYQEAYGMYLSLYKNLKGIMHEKAPLGRGSDIDCQKEAKMKAAVLYGNENIRYDDYPAPEVKPGTVKVKVKVTGICGSDVPRVLHNGAHFYPVVLGHEFAGDVVEVGEGVTRLRVGDTVSGVPLLPCMKCDDCQNGNYSLCKHYSFIGSREQGSFSEYVVLPEQNAVKYDSSIPYEQAAMFEPSSVALHGILCNDYRGGECVAILGGGTIGLFTMQWAKIFGARKVVVFDIDDGRLDLAKRMGADAVVNTKQENFMQYAMNLTDGKGYGYVFETAGNPVTMRMGFELAANKANVCFIGTPHTELTFTPPMWENMNRKEFKLTGSWMSYSPPFPGREWALTAAFFASGQLQFNDELVFRKFPMSDAGEAFALYRDPSQVHGKILLSNE